MITTFFDSHVRPPRGGWSFPIGGEMVTAYSEGDILEQLAKWHRNNGTFSTMEALRSQLWGYYCEMEPLRCGAGSVVVSGPVNVAPAPVLIAEKTPRLQGPPIWTFLNTVAAQWTPGLHNYFLATCDAITVILDCPDCRQEWRRLLASDTPIILSSRLEVCQWVCRMHNAVNSKTGKQLYPYSRMVAEFGAPL